MKEILTRIRHHSTEAPSRIAVEKGGCKLTFRQLELASSHLAEHLLDLGCRQVIAHYGRVEPELVISLVAAHKLGAAFVALDDALPNRVLQERLDAAEIEFVTKGASTGSDIIRKLGRTPVDVAHDAQSHRLFPEVASEEISHIRFTSGSTGRSRGVLLSRGHVERMTEVFEQFLKENPHDHFGLLGQFWPLVMFRALSAGATTHCIDFRNKGVMETRRWLRECQVTALFAYPQSARLIFGAGEAFPDIRYLHVSGDTISPADLRAFESSLCPGTAIHNSFGASEFPWILAEVHTVGDAIPDSRVPIGQPVIPGSVSLLREDGTRCESGETGQIAIASQDLPLAYLSDPKNTALAFRRVAGERAFLTGDMAFRSENGVHFGQGRNDDMIKIRGSNVWPTEVEKLLESHPSVDEAAVTAFERSDGETQLVAYFVSSCRVPAGELRAFLKSRVPDQMVPTVYQSTERLPRTDSGKLKRRELRPPNLVAAARKSGEPPAGATEQMIAEIWRSLLGFDEIGRHADFQDLGGDSLLAVRMLGEIEQALGRRVPIDTLSLEGATIVALARWIDGDGYRSSLVQLREGDPQRNLFVTPVAGGHLSDYFRLVDVFEGHHTILGVRPRGLNSEETPDATMDALAVGMLDTLVGNARGESLDLMGYSFGALSAYEVAYQACLRNVRIRNLILIDPPLNWSAPFPTLNWGLRPVLSGELTELSTRLRHLTNFVPPSRRIDAAHLRAALRFRPKPFFDVRTLVIVGDGQEGKKRMLASWPTLLNENVQITAIPARHTELMRLPTVARTAHVVSDWIATSPEPGS